MSIRRSRKITIILTAAALSILLLAIAILIFDRMFLSVDFHPVSFKSEVWKNTSSEFSLDSVRLRMVDDLLLTKLLVGLTRNNIVALIGEPDDTPYFREYPMVYHLGQERHPFGIDSEWLVIQLDKQGIATESLIVTD